MTLSLDAAYCNGQDHSDSDPVPSLTTSMLQIIAHSGRISHNSERM